jgi:hypothetical protein
MPEYGFVNQQYAAKDLQEQQNQRQQFGQMLNMAQMLKQQQQFEQQQAMQQANLQLHQRQLKDAEDDREFRSNMSIAQTGDYPVEMRLQALNKTAAKLGIQGTVTEEGLMPMNALLKQIVETKNKGGDISMYEPHIEMITANPRLIQPSALPQLADVSGAIKQQRAMEAVELGNPMPDEVQSAMKWTQDQKPQLERTLLELADEETYAVEGVGGALPVISPKVVPVSWQHGDAPRKGEEEGVQGVPMAGATSQPVAVVEEDTETDRSEPFAAGTRQSFRRYQPQGPTKPVQARMSEGRTAYLDERRQFVDEYRRKEAIVMADQKRKDLNAKVARVFQHDPEALKSVGRIGAAKATGLPIVGTDAKSMYELRGLEILAKPEEDWTPEQRRFKENVYDVLFGKDQSQVIKAEQLMQRIEENEQKQTALTTAAGFGQATEIQAERLKLQQRQKSLDEEIAKGSIPEERAAAITAERQQIETQMAALGGAEDEVAGQSLGQLTKIADSADARIQRLNDQIKRTPYDRVPIVRAQIEDAKRDKEVANTALGTLQRFSNSAMAARQEGMERDRTRMKAIDAELMKEGDLPQTTADQLIAERQGLANAITESEGWIKEGEKARAVAQARMTAHANFLKKENTRLVTARERQKMKDEHTAEQAAATDDYIARRSKGEPIEAVRPLMRELHPLAKLDDLEKAYQTIAKSQKETMLPLLQATYDARVKLGEDPTMVQIDLMKQGATREDLLKGVQQNKESGRDDREVAEASRKYMMAMQQYATTHGGKQPEGIEAMRLLGPIAEQHPTVKPQDIVKGFDSKMLSPEGAKDDKLSAPDRVNAVVKSQAMAAQMAGAADIIKPDGQIDLNKMMDRSAQDKQIYVESLKNLARTSSFKDVKDDILILANAAQKQLSAGQKTKAEIEGAIAQLPPPTSKGFSEAIEAAANGVTGIVEGPKGARFQVEADGSFTDLNTGHKFRAEGKGKSARWTTIK